MIFNKSLSDGIVPDDWKTSIISPIFKNKGDKKHACNYRPISLTSVVCKIYESLIRDKMMIHLTTNNLISDSQYGFRPGRSCAIQLLEVLDEWSTLLDSSNPVDTIYLDFSRAFDSVPHERLITKLFSLGIQGDLLQWIKCFLTGRTQCVRLNQCYSNLSEVISGVPQGSVLGPILFIVFINDLPEVVSGLVKIFADDSKIYSAVGNEQQQFDLQDDLDKLCDWSKKWKLSFNASKCKVMHFGT